MAAAPPKLLVYQLHTLARLLHRMRALAFCATLTAAQALPSSASAKHNVLFGARLRRSSPFSSVPSLTRPARRSAHG